MSMGPTEYDRGWADAMQRDAHANTITTPDQLSELPNGAAIRDHGGNILVRDGDLWLEPGASELTPEVPALLLWHPNWEQTMNGNDRFPEDISALGVPRNHPGVEPWSDGDDCDHLYNLNGGCQKCGHRVG